MKKIINLIIAASLFSLVSAVYNVGQTVSTADQNLELDVCFGDYPSNELKLADFNGDLNGGNYKVIHIDMAASW